MKEKSQKKVDSTGRICLAVIALVCVVALFVYWELQQSYVKYENYRGEKISLLFEQRISVNTKDALHLRVLEKPPSSSSSGGLFGSGANAYSVFVGIDCKVDEIKPELLEDLVLAYNADLEPEEALTVEEVKAALEGDILDVLLKRESFDVPYEQPYPFLEWCDKRANLVWVAAGNSPFEEPHEAGQVVKMADMPRNISFVLNRDRYPQYTYAWEYEAGQGESV